ncbi:DUF5837 family cyanobactin class RiPP [Phormidium sp. FACHB-1136]|uniref:DUF5837 family cyanobactin class RiPP n=1 Tax=Phormidium sp. FACHB-1136 TaxID=2692848 RepID=UPI001F5498CB|nr:DUF5837 family cyanobactin class RiPP [Phormidium sp. FACHB-1136]
MNHKSISPNPQQPVDRVPAGQLPSALAQLSEEVLGGAVAPAGENSRGEPMCFVAFCGCVCSYDGDDE